MVSGIMYPDCDCKATHNKFGTNMIQFLGSRNIFNLVYKTFIYCSFLENGSKSSIGDWMRLYS